MRTNAEIDALHELLGSAHFGEWGEANEDGVEELITPQITFGSGVFDSMHDYGLIDGAKLRLCVKLGHQWEVLGALFAFFDEELEDDISDEQLANRFAYFKAVEPSLEGDDQAFPYDSYRNGLVLGFDWCCRWMAREYIAEERMSILVLSYISQLAEMERVPDYANEIDYMEMYEFYRTDTSDTSNPEIPGASMAGADDYHSSAFSNFINGLDIE